MGKLKKIGIGFGITTGLFFALIITIGISVEMEKADMTPEELQQLENEREVIALQKQIDKEQEKKTRELIELSEKKWAEREAQVLQKEDETLDAEELQTIIAGFESYNKSVKILLDLCVNVESEDDFRVLGLLISESGNDFLVNTANYGTVRDKLISEGYGDHPELGPLLDQSEILVGGMSTCMEVLAWEFSG